MSYPFQLLRDVVNSDDAGKAAAERVFCPLKDRVHAKFFAWPIEVRDGERHRRFGDKIYGVAKVGADPGRRFAALLRLNPGDDDAAHTTFHEKRRQPRTGKHIPRLLVNHRLRLPRSEEIHQLVMRAGPLEPGIGVAVKEVNHREAVMAVEIDEARYVPLEISVASALPALRRDFERVLGVDDEQGRFGDGDVVYWTIWIGMGGRFASEYAPRFRVTAVVPSPLPKPLEILASERPFMMSASPGQFETSERLPDRAKRQTTQEIPLEENRKESNRRTSNNADRAQFSPLNQAICSK